MNDFEKMMVKSRFETLPLQTSEEREVELPTDAIEYLLEVVDWAARRAYHRGYSEGLDDGKYLEGEK